MTRRQDCMKVKDILKNACLFIGEKELAKTLEAETPSLEGKDEEKVDVLLRCFNLVNQEIASDYLPFLCTEKIDVNNSILSFEDLSKTLINVYELKGSFGKSVRYKLYPNYIEVFGRAKSITYSFLPSDFALSDEFEFYNGLSARIYAYGVASEYLLCDGLSEDAEIWEERFKESLFVLSRKKSETRLPKRRWI